MNDLTRLKNLLVLARRVVENNSVGSVLYLEELGDAIDEYDSANLSPAPDRSVHDA
jgi:hypothetical protein